MSLIKPALPSGVMELLPQEQMAFDHLLNVIRTAYQRFGFLPLETPVFERTDVLLTKSGGETEKQVYFVQSTGSLAQGDAPDMALRFDLTVPLARFVAMHERDLPMPFRRYQIQRVYRGERAQKGRYREFYQCDIDVIGRDTLDIAYDAELPAIIYKILSALDIGSFTINFSNRKILQGLLLDYALNDEQRTHTLRIIDKLDKIGKAAVLAELEKIGLATAQAQNLLELVTGSSTGRETIGNQQILVQLRALPCNHDLFKEGLQELASVVTDLESLGIPEQAARINLAITRGLDYYTGTVYETFLTAAPEFGSICSGGRYDNLASHYTKAKLPGVGISIGATRLFDYLRSSGWSARIGSTVNALLLPLTANARGASLQIASTLRLDNLNIETAPVTNNPGKWLKYADKAGIPFVLLMGDEELASGLVTLKDMRSGEQQKISADKISNILQHSR